MRIHRGYEDIGLGGEFISFIAAYCAV